MRELASSLEGSFGAPTYDLGTMERVPHAGAFTMSCYSVETTEASELDELPQRLGKQARANGSMFR